MTESGPREGIYLDAAIAAIGERVDDRIDRLVARRRIRTRALVAALAVSTVVGGAATAAALAVAPIASPPTPLVEREVSCVTGDDPDAAAFFATRYRIPADGADRISPAELCELALTTLASRPDLADASPARLLASAAELLRSTSTPLEIDGESVPLPRVDVVFANFGVSPAAGGTTLARCGDEHTTTVLVTDGAGSVPADCVALGDAG